MKIKTIILSTALLIVGLTMAYTNGVFAIVEPQQPIIINFTPIEGPTEGNTPVTINGENLSQITTIKFDNITATITSATNTSLVTLSPPHTAGTVSITLETTNQTITAPGTYTYIETTPPPDDDNGEETADPCIQNKKIAICHLPPGNSLAQKTICLPQPAVSAHMKKHTNDHLGTCKNSYIDKKEPVPPNNKKVQ